LGSQNNFPNLFTPFSSHMRLFSPPPLIIIPCFLCLSMFLEMQPLSFFLCFAPFPMLPTPKSTIIRSYVPSSPPSPPQVHELPILFFPFLSNCPHPRFFPVSLPPSSHTHHSLSLRWLWSHQPYFPHPLLLCKWEAVFWKTVFPPPPPHQRVSALPSHLDLALLYPFPPTRSLHSAAFPLGLKDHLFFPTSPISLLPDTFPEISPIAPFMPPVP